MSVEAPTAPAPAAASSPAPASSPSSAPSSPSSAPSSPSSTPAAAPAPNFGAGAGVVSHVNPASFKPGSDDYTKAVLAEQLAAIPAEVGGDPAEQPSTAPDEQAEPKIEPVVEVPAPDAEPKPEEVKPAEVEPEFQLEPEAIVTPEALTQMVTENAEFGKLLEADPKLKGQLYKTAREAAELKPYREMFPDLDSAKSAHQSATTFNDVRETFMGSTTREGTLATLGKMAELSYERDDSGNVVMQNGKPLIGDDYKSFVKNVEDFGLERRKAEVEARFKANQYHLRPGATQEEVDAAHALDQGRLALIDDLLGQVADSPNPEQLPEFVKQRLQEVEQREQQLKQREHGGKIEQRKTFETELQTEAQTRLSTQIGKILSSVKKQGGVISPYLEKILPQSIGAKVVAKIAKNPILQDQMKELQRLPVNDSSRQRRVAAIDRAYQLYLGDVAREELAAAGVQVTSASAAKTAKVNGQAAATQQTEIRGSTGHTRGGAPMSANDAYSQAKGEWEKANPGRRFDKAAESQILGRVVNLQLPG